MYEIQVVLVDRGAPSSHIAIVSLKKGGSFFISLISNSICPSTVCFASNLIEIDSVVLDKNIF